MVLALAPQDITFWEITLAIGAVVLVAVIALLSLLLSIVRSIETNVLRLQEAAQGVRSDTANIKVALAIVDSLDEVTKEAGRHAQLLGVGEK
jgi:energy-converting hydrogenase Eha subunit H